jgi:hypothetical protein
MPTLMPISVPSEPIEHASLALAGALEGDLPLETSVTLAEALAVLSDVTPPYPPLLASVPPLPIAEGLALASAHLAEAIDAALDAEERLRCARALGLLSPLVARGEP